MLFPSQRGSDKLANEGFIYVKDKAYDKHSTWRCERSRWTQNKCFGRAKLINDVVQVTSEHNHFPDPAHVEAESAKASYLSCFA